MSRCSMSIRCELSRNRRREIYPKALTVPPMVTFVLPAMP